MRKLAFCLLAAAILIPAAPKEPEARLNPLKWITDRFLRPDVIIVLDVSGSMANDEAGNDVGSDCGGPVDADVDICGDLMCTAAEETACSDCAFASDDINGTTDTSAGFATKCTDKHDDISRMMIAKKTLQAVLPEFRTVANFGLVTYDQTGYFAYFPAGAASGSNGAIFLHQWELRSGHSWVALGGGTGWAAGPHGSFTAYNITYNRGGGTAGDSLYQRITPSGIDYKRFNWAATGGQLEYDDGADTWQYVGSYYTFPTYARTVVAPTVLGNYRGPIYNDGTNFWVYNRFGPEDGSYPFGGGAPSTLYGLDAPATWAGAADVLVPIQGTNQTASNNALGAILNRINFADNGGLFAHGRTPTAEGIAAAQAQFAAKGDGDKGCRPRFILVLTDGASTGSDPVAAVQAAYNADANNPIQTIALGLPGLPSATELDDMADRGDNGLLDGSASGKTSSTMKEFLDNLRDELNKRLSNDFVTTAAAVATSVDADVKGDLAIVASTEYPSWRGHVRALDLTQDPASGSYEKWDAASKLNSNPWDDRVIYSVDAAGTMYQPIEGGPIKYNEAEVQGVWPGTGGACVTHADCAGASEYCSAGTCAAPPVAIIQDMLRWLMGEGRAWRMGPVLNVVPAVIGAPPMWPTTVGGHAALETTHQTRPAVVYVPTNDGVIHAFCKETGNELFAFVPPFAWAKIYKVFRQGGQKNDPGAFVWILAASPRVEDLPKDSVWKTYLIQNAGPADNKLIVLDITNPVDNASCATEDEASSCTLNDPPVQVRFRSATEQAHMNTYYGETWSVPALSWKKSAKGASVISGSGYTTGAAAADDYYNFWEKVDPTGAWDTGTHTGVSHGPAGTAGLDEAVTAFGVVIRDNANGMASWACYQGFMTGKIERFDQCKSSNTTIIDGSTSNPFFFSPAAYFSSIADGVVTVAANSGAYWADDSFLTGGSFETTLYLRKEDDGSALSGAGYNLACTVSELCAPTSADCSFDDAPATCNAPPSSAMAVGSPLLIDNSATGLMEAFYLLYVPPTSTCELDGGGVPTGEVNVGDSWVVRIGMSGTGQELIMSKRYDKTIATGFTIVGGGAEVGISTTGVGAGGAKAKVQTMGGSPLGSGPAATTSQAVLESWQEVR